MQNSSTGSMSTLHTLVGCDTRDHSWRMIMYEGGRGKSGEQLSHWNLLSDVSVFHQLSNHDPWFLSRDSFKSLFQRRFYSDLKSLYGIVLSVPSILNTFPSSPGPTVRFDTMGMRKSSSSVKASIASATVLQQTVEKSLALESENSRLRHHVSILSRRLHEVLAELRKRSKITAAFCLFCGGNHNQVDCSDW